MANLIIDGSLREGGTVRVDADDSNRLFAEPVVAGRPATPGAAGDDEGIEPDSIE